MATVVHVMWSPAGWSACDKCVATQAQTGKGPRVPLDEVGRGPNEPEKPRPNVNPRSSLNPRRALSRRGAARDAPNASTPLLCVLFPVQLLVRRFRKLHLESENDCFLGLTFAKSDEMPGNPPGLPPHCTS